MKVLRFILATTALLFVWLIVSVGVGWLIGIIFQPKSEAHFLVFWLDWHALPGLAIGLERVLNFGGEKSVHCKYNPAISWG